MDHHFAVYDKKTKIVVFVGTTDVEKPELADNLDYIEIPEHDSYVFGKTYVNGEFVTPMPVV